MTDVQPLVFIGSSAESWPVAEKIGRQLTAVAVVRQWKRVFEPGEYTLERLQSETRNVDFAVFVLAADDLVNSRGKREQAPRDNVVLEAGMFLAALGRGRTFLIEDSSARLKLPSDLLGLTTLRYDGDTLRAARPNWARFHRDVSAHLRERVDHLGPIGETGLPESVVRLFSATLRRDTRLPLSVLSARYTADIARYLETLFQDSHFERHATAGLRLRRIFEDGGRYLEGIEVNRRVVQSLQKLGRIEDARWAELKGVAYLEVLSGRHRVARERLTALLRETEPVAAENRLLRAYSHRYLAISYHRDPVTRDLARARAELELALHEAKAIELSKPTDYMRFQAKVWRNLANVDMDGSADYETAIDRFERSRRIFESLSDFEHHGITALAIAKARIAQSRIGAKLDAHRVNSLIRQAERSAMMLGWPEGLGNVHETRAELLLLRAERATGLAAKKRLLSEAKDAALSAQAYFQGTDATHRVLAVGALADRIDVLTQTP